MRIPFGSIRSVLAAFLPASLAASLAGLAVAAPAGCLKRPPSLSRQDQAAILERLAPARRRADEMSRAWRAAFAGPITLVPRKDLGRCPFHPAVEEKARPRRSEGGPENLELAIEMHGPTATELRQIVPAAELTASDSPEAVLLRKRISELEGDVSQALADRKDELRSAADAIVAKADVRHDWVVVVDEKQDPFASPSPAGETREFRPGYMEGRAYVLDFTTGTIVCASRFEATSSEKVDFLEPQGYIGITPTDKRLSGISALHLDLDIQVRQAARAALVAAGPPR